MTSRDVRDIMELGTAVPTANTSLQPPRKSGPPDPRQKRPEGITRELYALIGDNAPSLALAQAVKPKFKDRIKRQGPGVKWQWTGFTVASRGAGKVDESDDREKEARKKLKLHHWVRDLPPGHKDGTPDAKFAKFNTSSQPFSYTSEEYNHFLREDDWPKDETDRLFLLAHEYDLRFVIVADRWDYPSERSVDELKARYYSVCRKLVRNRPAADETARQNALQSLSFDLHRELDRKAYLKSLLSRTPAQIAEEEFLYVESRRLEQSYNKIAAERADLLRILGGRDGVGAQGGVQVGVGGGVKGASSTAKSNEKDTSANKKKNQTGWELEGLNGGGLPDGWAGEGSKRKATVSQDIINCIERHPAPSVSATKALPYPSVSVRSSRIATPKATVLNKVQAALAELNISSNLILPTKGNVEKLDALQVALGQLVEMKKAVDRIDGEIRVVKKRRAAMTGVEPDRDGSVKKEEEIEVDSTNREDSARTKRSASASSTATSANKRARRE